MGHYSHPPLMKLIMKACFDSKGTILHHIKNKYPFPNPLHNTPTIIFLHISQQHHTYPNQVQYTNTLKFIYHLFSTSLPSPNLLRRKWATHPFPCHPQALFPFYICGNTANHVHEFIKFVVELVVLDPYRIQLKEDSPSSNQKAISSSTYHS